MVDLETLLKDFENENGFYRGVLPQPGMKGPSMTPPRFMERSVATGSSDYPLRFGTAPQLLVFGKLSHFQIRKALRRKALWRKSAFLFPPFSSPGKILVGII